MIGCFLDIVETMKEIRLLGDAFDECVNWNDLWYLLCQISRRKCSSLRFLFTSHPESSICDAVHALDIPSIDLSLYESIDRDIRTFVSESLEYNPRFSRISDEGKGLIRDSLISRANRMCVVHFSIPVSLFITIRFRWVSLQLDSLSRCRSIATVKAALSSLPPTLHETYARILQQIADEEKSRVRQILQILCVAVRPIRLTAAAEIYQIGDDIQPPFTSDSGLFHPEDSIDICQGLLSLMAMSGDDAYDLMEESITIIQLAHFSVKEYLLSSCSLSWTLSEEASHISIIRTSIASFLKAAECGAALRPYDHDMRYTLAECA
jgi:ankyrin repeat domain-containing protein 50